MGDFAHDNTIKGNKIVGNEEEGIFFNNSDGNKIQRNKIDKNGKQGILLDVDSDDNQFLFNRILRNADLDIQDDGTNNVFEGNKCGTSFPATICMD